MSRSAVHHHRVRCLSCGHAWNIDYQATEAARSHAVLTAASCPVCGSGPAVAVEAADRSKPARTETA